MKFPTYEEMAKDVAEKALDNFLFDGKSIREWMQIIASEDAISRQAAIDSCLNGWNKGYKEIVEEIRALPPVTPAEKPNKWIPVSERYPEDGQRVLVDYCDEDAGIMLIRFNVNGYRGFKAWMPLPERFEGNAK